MSSKVESNLMLGIGEKHGVDGIKWLVNNINKEYSIKDNGVVKEVQCFMKSKKIRLIGENKHRDFYYFDLADWHIMCKTLKTENVISRFAYDVNWLTKEVGILKKDYRNVHNFIYILMRKVQFSNKFSLLK